MKRFLLYAAILALAASPALAQPRPGNEHRGDEHRDMGNPPQRAPNRAPGTMNQRPRPPQAPRQAPRPPSQAQRRPDRRPDYRPSQARPHREWNTWRSQHRDYFSRPARRFHAPLYHRPSGWYYRRWSFGDILPSLFWSSPYWIGNYSLYALPPPPPGAIWVRYGSDAILIDRFSGEVIEVVYGIFY